MDSGGQRPVNEDDAVRELGERIGYGRMMQLAEKIWNEKQPGGAHSVGPCVVFLVACPHPENVAPHECDWCCGSGRITHRVYDAMMGL